MEEPLSVAVVGASGYAGAELLRLLASHSGFEVVIATADSKQGMMVGDLYPSLRLDYPNLQFTPFQPEYVAEASVVFLALPHGVSMSVVPQLIDSVEYLIDLGSDFRLQDETLYPVWYKQDHVAPELLPTFTYGLPELFRSQITASRRVAATGCNAAASILAMSPFVSQKMVEADGIVLDIKAGVSGAGRPPKEQTTFCETNENVEAYALLSHRHTPEVEQALSQHAGVDVSVLVTTHLVPINRGIFATCYARPSQKVTSREATDILAEFYKDEPFISVGEESPATKSVRGSSGVHLAARVDPRTGMLIVLAAMDNLGKGAAGMAIQCANSMVGYAETTGLPLAGVMP